MTDSLNYLDWLVIAVFIGSMMAVGAMFTKKASGNIESFFVSNRSLKWYIAGGSLIATSFAADTPLWVTSLIRQYGVYYIWQYWAPMIGGAMAIVLFSRLWRRIGVLTDIEFVELRYSGKPAKFLRFYSGAMLALFYCPLTIGWVTKAMETIAREAMGLPPQYQIWTTVLVISVALIMCTLSGLYGVVYTDFIQFVIATAGTITLACVAVHHVGGLDSMVQKLSEMQSWNGRNLNIAPDIGPGLTQMSIWNAIGYFGILWLMVAVSGGYQAQRLLACKDWRHSSLAMTMHSVFYYGLVCWPWIVVGLCSLIVFPELGEGVSHDSAYPKMIIKLFPAGLRGLLVAAMLAAFISTISTMFNWGSSYLINDVYKRFIAKNRKDNHYVTMARLATIIMAVAGGIISLVAKDIQQLLAIAFVVGSAVTLVAILRWFWWRLNAVGDLAATAVAWTVTPLLLFAKIFDAPARSIFNLPEDVNLSSDPNLLGARMLFVIIASTVAAVIGSLLSKPTDIEQLKKFVLKARPFGFFWKPVIINMDIAYKSKESFLRTIISWLIAVTSIGSLIFGIGKLLLGQPKTGLGLLAIALVTVIVTVIRINQDFNADNSQANE